MEINVYEDCWELVQRYQRKVNDGEDCDFRTFCNCWRDMNMHNLYSGQSNSVEVIGTTLAALHVAKRLACSRRTSGETFPASRSLRTAGFFLLHVIYNKQPTKHFIKIEASPRTWQELTDYVLVLQRQSPDKLDSQQVAYMFWSLVQNQAFRFTALDYAQGLDALVDYDRLEYQTGGKRQKESATASKQQRPNNAKLAYELEGLRVLKLASQPLCDLEAGYNAQKSRLQGQELGLPPTKIFGQLREVFGDIQKLLKEDSEEEEPCHSGASNAQLEVRQQVRHKAQYGDVDRKQLVSPDPEVNRHYQRRMCSATVFQQKLPREVEREYDLDEEDETD